MSETIPSSSSRLSKMTDMYQSCEESISTEKDSMKEIHLPDGYELTHYTLRRVHDGHLQSYTLVGPNFITVPTLPTTTQTSGIQGSGSRDSVQKVPSSYLLLPFRSSNPKPNQQAYGVPASRNRESPKRSEKTLKRYAHARDDDYTDVCGVYSSAKATPVTRFNRGQGDFCCPRCGSNYTRPKSVKDHFPDCVSKCGNPQALRYTDHPSMSQREAGIQRRSQASREPSTVDLEGESVQANTNDQKVKFEDMNDTLGSTPIHGVQDHASTHDGTNIKIEFVFGADVAYQSVETPFPEHQSQSIILDANHTSFQSTSFLHQAHTAQTPDWQVARSASERTGSSTPTPHTNPWNIGIPGSAAEHAIMDMRATAPFEGYLHESQTPEPTHGYGLQGDGLDGFMDRRSFFSATPAACGPSSRMGDYDMEDEMEE